MSQHSSLKANTMKRHRSVLKRLEKIKILQEKGEWKEAFLGLPKIKTLKIKIKKEKAKKTEEEKATAPKPAGETTEEKKRSKNKNRGKEKK